MEEVVEDREGGCYSSEESREERQVLIGSWLRHMPEHEEPNITWRHT